MAWSIQAWFLALAGIVIGIAGGADAGEDLTADEVLAKSQAAMAPPIQYRLLNSGIESVVSVKDLGGEVGVATRVETVNPILEQVSLTTAKQALEWRPKTGLAIDKSLFGEAMLAQVAAIRQAMPSGSTSRLLDPETIDGVEHYVVETTVPQGFSDAIAKMLSLSKPLSGISRSWIESQTFHLRKVVNVSGEMEYRDIRQGVDLPNELFLPPPGITFEKPTTIHEYVKIVSREARREATAPIPKIELRKSDPPIWDPVKKTWKGAAPPGWTQEDWDAYVESMPSKPRPAEAPLETPKTQATSRRWILYANVALLAALTGYAIFRGFSSRRRRA